MNFTAEQIQIASMIRSLAYFSPVIEEVLESRVNPE